MNSSWLATSLATDVRGDISMRIMPLILVGLILLVLAILWDVLL